MKKVPCARCGVERVTQWVRTTPLCKDCRYVLSEKEIEAWE